MNNRFMKAVQMKLVGLREKEFPLMVVEREMETPYSVETLNAYRLSLNWSRIVQYERGQGDMALRLFLEELHEALYGDFRKDMIDLERAVFEQKREETIKIVERMREKMFGR